MCNTLHGYPETFITSRARKIISVNLDCYRLNKRGLQPQRPQTIQGLKLFLVKGAFFKSVIRRLDKFFVILKPIKVLSVADPRLNQVGVRFGLVSVSLRSRFGLVSVLFRRKTILTAARKRPPLARWPSGLMRL